MPMTALTPREAVEHHRDERPVAPARERARVDRLEEPARLGRREHRRRALRDNGLRPPHGRRRVHRQDLADDEQMIEQSAARHRLDATIGMARAWISNVSSSNPTRLLGAGSKHPHARARTVARAVPGSGPPVLLRCLHGPRHRPPTHKITRLMSVFWSQPGNRLVRRGFEDGGTRSPNTTRARERY